MTFIDQNNPSDSGFNLTLSQDTEYAQMVNAVAKYLDIYPTYLKFYKTQNYWEGPFKQYEGTLKDLFVHFRPKQSIKIFYRKLVLTIRM